eukprot:3708206-Amphidinium_carterae.1
MTSSSSGTSSSEEAEKDKKGKKKKKKTKKDKKEKKDKVTADFVRAKQPHLGWCSSRLQSRLKAIFDL